MIIMLPYRTLNLIQDTSGLPVQLIVHNTLHYCLSFSLLLLSFNLIYLKLLNL